MKLSIIIIGDEILLGQVTDTNSGEIARILGPEGWDIASVKVVGDNEAAIHTAVADALRASDLVITTGGLGPTKDDITKNVLMKHFGGSLVFNKDVLENVETVFRKRGLRLNELTRQQAMVPSSCRVIQNQLGTAPIMWFEADGKVLISMPGVPFETIGMLHRSVKDEIKRRFHNDEKVLHHTLIVSGITESDLATKISDLEDSLPENAHLAYLPVPGYIRLRLDTRWHIGDGNAEAAAVSIARKFKDRLGALVIADEDKTPECILLDMLRERQLTVGTAESCTGGNIAHLITSVPGSSDCFMGGVVSYSNWVKENVLRVPAKAIEENGAVSEPVVRAMAAGASQALGCACAVATSGVAGPGGGTPEKPVGTVWMAALTPAGVEAQVRHFPGNRQRVIERASTEAILMLIRLLRAE